jgi:guanosine-3',5'-bis(diphosphate) 3'-pyrophosphohydrolase
VETHRHQIQGLHRTPQAQYVPVAAHHRHRARGERIEIQIRTPRWTWWPNRASPRTGVTRKGAHLDEKVSKTFAWIQNLVENQENFGIPMNFWKTCASISFRTKFTCFTPNGDVKTLPKGATPVDFAYLIHTEVGNQCTGAKVNGRMVPLRHVLVTGDTVEIITTKGHHPSKDWLNFVKTVKARSRIRQWIKTQEKERSLTLGREMCEKAFRKYKLNFNPALKSDKIDEVVAHFGFKTADDLIASVGYGKITPLQLVRRFDPHERSEAEGESILNRIIGRVRRKKEKTGVKVKGVDDILVKFGKCCQPVPGDPITGYITQGSGVTIHRTNCINALKMNPERQIEVEWNLESGNTFPVKILIRSLDRVGLLADIAANISKAGANILSLNTKTQENGTVDSHLTISVDDTEHLKTVMALVKKVRLVQDVRRVDG